MDRWLNHFDSKRRAAMQAMARRSVAMHHPPLPAASDAACLDRMRCADQEYTQVLHACELYRKMVATKLSAHALGTTLLRGHLAAGAAQGEWVPAEELSALIPSDSTLASDVGQIVQDKLDHDRLREEWIQSMRRRLEYHEQAFEQERAMCARIVRLHSDLLYRFRSATSPDGLRPWPEVRQKLMMASGEPQPANAAELLGRFKELEDVRALLRGVE